MERAGPSVGGERKLSRVVATLDRDDAQRAGHVLVDDLDNSLGGRFDRVEAHRVGDLLHGRVSRFDIELHLAPRSFGGR